MFATKIISSSGVLTRGQIEARDVDAVRRQVQSQGGLAVETREIHPARVRLRSARTLDLAMATDELTMLLGAGQTIEQALGLLIEGAAPRSLRTAFDLALGKLRDGASFADALAATSRFPPIYLAMVQAGEASGALTEQLGKLALMLERAARMREQMISALIYPALLVAVAVSAVILLLGQVVPQFAPLFVNSSRPLPLATRAVLAASEMMRADGLLALAVVVLATLGVMLACRRPALAGWCDDQLLRLPLIGPMLVLAATARWMRVLAVLLKGGVALPAGLDLVGPVAGHRRIRTMIDALHAGIKDGKGLIAALPPRAPLPDLARQLLKVGEQSGRLEDSLGRLADLFDSRLEQTIKRALAIFEPACVLALSLMVGTIVVSILLAVVSINDLAL
jgi:general secretion pathway protein F